MKRIGLEPNVLEHTGLASRQLAILYETNDYLKFGGDSIKTLPPTLVLNDDETRSDGLLEFGLVQTVLDLTQLRE